jgi:hypothetical protein
MRQIRLKNQSCFNHWRIHIVFISLQYPVLVDFTHTRLEIIHLLIVIINRIMFSEFRVTSSLAPAWVPLSAPSSTRSTPPRPTCRCEVDNCCLGSRAGRIPYFLAGRIRTQSFSPDNCTILVIFLPEEVEFF